MQLHSVTSSKLNARVENFATETLAPLETTIHVEQQSHCVETTLAQTPVVEQSRFVARFAGEQLADESHVAE